MKFTTSVFAYLNNPHADNHYSLCDLHNTLWCGSVCDHDAACLTPSTTDEGEVEQYWGSGGDEGLWVSQIELVHQKLTDHVLETHPVLVTLS